jgi:hypothetical protein
MGRVCRRLEMGMSTLAVKAKAPRLARECSYCVKNARTMQLMRVDAASLHQGYQPVAMALNAAGQFELKDCRTHYCR